MNTNQELKMQLLKEFGIYDEIKSIEFCREAYKFLIEGDVMKVLGVDAKTGEPIIERMAPGTTKNNDTEVKAIDLGLPSGTLWADRNVCAKSPEDYGAFFSWGNTEPHYPKPTTDWGDDYNAFEDYPFNSETYDKTEGAKLDGSIGAKHDAATVNLGKPWKMPTEDDFQELYDNCIWERKTINGVNGYKVTSKKNDNYIFFACSGYGYGSSWDYRGSLGNYWSASFYSARTARSLNFYSGGVGPQDGNSRYYGFAVRAVQYTKPKK